MHLMPMQTAFYSAAGDFENAAKLGNTLACIECGACEYTCPAKRPLIQAIRKTKAYIRSKVNPQPLVKPVDQKGKSAPIVPPTEDAKISKPVQEVLDKIADGKRGSLENTAVKENTVEEKPEQTDGNKEEK